MESNKWNPTEQSQMVRGSSNNIILGSHLNWLVFEGGDCEIANLPHLCFAQINIGGHFTKDMIGSPWTEFSCLGHSVAALSGLMDL